MGFACYEVTSRDDFSLLLVAGRGGPGLHAPRLLGLEDWKARRRDPVAVEEEGRASALSPAALNPLSWTDFRFIRHT